MRAAPSVEVVAALKGGWWLTALGVWSGALMALLLTLGWHCWVEGASSLTGQLPWLLGSLLFGVIVLSSAGAALWHARRFPAKLRWDGEVWLCIVPGHLGQDPLPGRVALMLDVGDAMLLRWQSDSDGESPRRTVWLPVAKGGQPAVWHRLRVALHGMNRSGVVA